LFSAASTTDAAMADSTPRRRQRHHAQRGQGQRDRVRQREGGDDLGHVDQGIAQPRCRLPGRLHPHQHRRQQQRQQEQDVVEPDPDVPHTFAQELHEGAAGTPSGTLEALFGPVRVQHRAARAAGVGQAQQAAVRRVDVGKQRVAQRQRARPGRALEREGQHRVGPVGVFVHLLIARPRAAGLAVGGDDQVRQRV
jgi:hypothetical protein